MMNEQLRTVIFVKSRKNATKNSKTASTWCDVVFLIFSSILPPTIFAQITVVCSERTLHDDFTHSVTYSTEILNCMHKSCWQILLTLHKRP
jgi:hypothetical protein